MADEEKKKICFVIGPIGSAGSQTRINADFLLDGIIKEVLEKDPFGYEVKRADKDVSLGSINSAVINDIINADLAIADLSERNPNAFYELGIRHAYDKPVIHMIQQDEQIPFDNFDQRCIPFSTASWPGILSARASLRACVEYALSSDYKPSNPVRIAKALQSMADSGEDVEDVLNSLVEEVSFLKEENTSLRNKLNEEKNEISKKNLAKALLFTDFYEPYREGASVLLRSLKNSEVNKKS